MPGCRPSGAGDPIIDSQEDDSKGDRRQSWMNLTVQSDKKMLWLLKYRTDSVLLATPPTCSLFIRPGGWLASFRTSPRDLQPSVVQSEPGMTRAASGLTGFHRRRLRKLDKSDRPSVPGLGHPTAACQLASVSVAQPLPRRQKPDQVLCRGCCVRNQETQGTAVTTIEGRTGRDLRYSTGGGRADEVHEPSGFIFSRCVANPARPLSGLAISPMEITRSRPSMLFAELLECCGLSTGPV